MLYLRHESPTLDSRGVHVGVFRLANGLARSGHRTPGTVIYEDEVQIVVSSPA